MHKSDVVIVGGGVVGLSLAWVLARRGTSVQILDKGEPGREASWAGAGILPPANRRTALHPLDALRGLSCELHPAWAEQLRAETGVDNGFRRCGGLYLARQAGEAASLGAWAKTLSDEEIACQRVSPAQLTELDPGLRVNAARDDAAPLRAAYYLPAEAQIRNPRHLQALRAACELRGVRIVAGAEVVEIEAAGERLLAVRTADESFSAGQFLFTAGAWTGGLLARFGRPLGVAPMRGQIVLFQSEKPPLTRIVNEGPRYLVPRDDGLVLAGSTEEEAGFDKRTTPEAIAELIAFARGLCPALEQAEIVRTWAGLRPASFDGFPYLGTIPGWSNGFVAAGHFRTGLYLSPATARVLAQVLFGETPEVDLTPFRVER